MPRHKPNHPNWMRWLHNKINSAANSSANSAAFKLVNYFHNHYIYDNHYYDHNCAFLNADYSSAF